MPKERYPDEQTTKLATSHVHKLKFFARLPTELVLTILKNLNEEALLSYRLTSRFGADVSTLLLFENKSKIAANYQDKLMRYWLQDPARNRYGTLNLNHIRKNPEGSIQHKFYSLFFIASMQDIDIAPVLDKYIAEILKLVQSSSKSVHESALKLLDSLPPLKIKTIIQPLLEECIAGIQDNSERGAQKIALETVTQLGMQLTPLQIREQFTRITPLLNDPDFKDSAEKALTVLVSKTNDEHIEIIYQSIQDELTLKEQKIRLDTLIIFKKIAPRLMAEDFQTHYVTLKTLLTDGVHELAFKIFLDNGNKLKTLQREDLLLYLKNNMQIGSILKLLGHWADLWNEAQITSFIQDIITWYQEDEKLHLPVLNMLMDFVPQFNSEQAKLISFMLKLSDEEYSCRKGLKVFALLANQLTRESLIDLLPILQPCVFHQNEAISRDARETLKRFTYKLHKNDTEFLLLQIKDYLSLQSWQLHRALQTLTILTDMITDKQIQELFPLVKQHLSEGTIYKLTLNCLSAMASRLIPPETDYLFAHAQRQLEVSQPLRRGSFRIIAHLHTQWTTERLKKLLLNPCENFDIACERGIISEVLQTLFLLAKKLDSEQIKLFNPLIYKVIGNQKLSVYKIALQILIEWNEHFSAQQIEYLLPYIENNLFSTNAVIRSLSAALLMHWLVMDRIDLIHYRSLDEIDSKKEKSIEGILLHSTMALYKEIKTHQNQADLVSTSYVMN